MLSVRVVNSGASDPFGVRSQHRSKSKGSNGDPGKSEFPASYIGCAAVVSGKDGRNDNTEFRSLSVNSISHELAGEFWYSILSIRGVSAVKLAGGVRGTEGSLLNSGAESKRNTSSSPITGPAATGVCAASGEYIASVASSTVGKGEGMDAEAAELFRRFVGRDVPSDETRSACTVLSCRTTKSFLENWQLHMLQAYGFSIVSLYVSSRSSHPAVSCFLGAELTTALMSDTVLASPERRRAVRTFVSLL